MSKKRAIRSQFLILFATILLVTISIFKIPSFITNTKLEALGYSKDSITAIKKHKISKILIDNEYFTDYLNKEITKDSFDAKYLDLYLIRNNLSDIDFQIYDKLLLKTYTKEEVTKLFKALNNDKLTPLLVYDKVDVDTYISNPDGDYLNPYSNTIEIKEPSKIDTLVNTKFSLANYAPSKLAPIAREFASDGITLENEAYGNFINMCKALKEMKLGIYAIEGYRSFETQESLVNQKISSIKAGHSDLQTGLAVFVMNTYGTSVEDFKASNEHKWLKENAHKYGFIQRYPAGKEKVTGQKETVNYYRYVGVDLATKVYESGLTYDEYYMLNIYDYKNEIK